MSTGDTGSFGTTALILFPDTDIGDMRIFPAIKTAGVTEPQLLFSAVISY